MCFTGQFLFRNFYKSQKCIKYHSRSKKWAINGRAGIDSTKFCRTCGQGILKTIFLVGQQWDKLVVRSGKGRRDPPHTGFGAMPLEKLSKNQHFVTKMCTFDVDF